MLALAVALFVGTASSAAAAAPVTSSGDVTTAFQIDAAHDGVQGDDSLRAPLSRRWSVYLPLPQSDPQVSFPVIVGGRVFVTAWSYGGENYAYALDLRSGQIDWGPVDIGPSGHWSSLTYDGGRLFVTDAAGNLLALDPATGQTLWEDAGAVGDDSPTATGGVLYSGPNLQAFNEATGAVTWTGTTESQGLTAVSGMPAVSGGDVFTAGEDDNVFGFTTAGEPLWSYQGPDAGGTAVQPVFSGGQVLVRSPTVAYQDVYPGWIHSAATGRQTGSFRSFTVPAATDGYLYTTPTTETGDSSYDTYELAAIDRSTGTQAWSFDGDNQLDAAPVVANGVVYEGSWGQNLYALNATTGQELWSTTLAGAVPPSDETQDTAPLSGLGIGGGYLVVPTTLNGATSGATLTAFGPQAGTGSLSADTTAFGSEPVGERSASASVALTNTGAAALTVSAPKLSGADPGDFAVVSNACGGVQLAAGAACSVTVAFTPQSQGARSATLTIPTGDGETHAVALSGTGTPGSTVTPPTTTSTASGPPTTTMSSSPSTTSASTPSASTGPAPPAPLGTPSAAAVSRDMLSDRRLVTNAVVVRALVRTGRARVSLVYPSRGLLSVELILAGRAHRALVLTLFSRNLGPGRHKITLLLGRADRARLSAGSARHELIVVFRPTGV